MDEIEIPCYHVVKGERALDAIFRGGRVLSAGARGEAVEGSILWGDDKVSTRIDVDHYDNPMLVADYLSRDYKYVFCSVGVPVFAALIHPVDMAGEAGEYTQSCMSFLRRRPGGQWLRNHDVPNDPFFVFDAVRLIEELGAGLRTRDLLGQHTRLANDMKEDVKYALSGPSTPAKDRVLSEVMDRMEEEAMKKTEFGGRAVEVLENGCEFWAEDQGVGIIYMEILVPDSIPIEFAHWLFDGEDWIELR